MANRGLVVDGADRFAAGLYALAAALAAAAVELAGHPQVFGPWSPWWPVGAGLLCAGGSLPTPLARKAPAAAAVRAVCWLAAAGWVAYGYRWGLSGRHAALFGRRVELWHAVYWQALLFGGLGLGVLATVFATPTDLGLPMRPEPEPTAGPPAEPAADTTGWADRIAKVANKEGCRGITVTPWGTGAGYRVAGWLPDDGTTWQDLQRHEAGFAANLNLPRGCGVEAGPGPTRGAFVLDVATSDAMAESREYPG